MKYHFRYLPTNCLSVFDHFVKLALKGVKFCTTDTVLYLWQFGVFFQIAIQTEELQLKVITSVSLVSEVHECYFLVIYVIL